MMTFPNGISDETKVSCNSDEDGKHNFLTKTILTKKIEVVAKNRNLSKTKTIFDQHRNFDKKVEVVACF